ncbi:MAG: hypothetical protein QQN63_04095 [Nitrosopumilus sp.]
MTLQIPLQTIISPTKSAPYVGESGVYRVEVEAEYADDPTRRFEISRDVIATDAGAAIRVFGNSNFEDYKIHGVLGVRFLRKYSATGTLGESL